MHYSTTWYTAGNPRWQAPEILRARSKEEGRRTEASDIFAFGRVMLEVSNFHIMIETQA